MPAFYLVSFDGLFPSATGKRRATGIYERDFDDCGRETTIRDILGGQFENIDRVVMVDPEAGTSEDVTEEIARECLNEADGPLCRAAQNFIEEWIGITAAREVNEAHGFAGVGA